MGSPSGKENTQGIGGTEETSSKMVGPRSKGHHSCASKGGAKVVGLFVHWADAPPPSDPGEVSVKLGMHMAHVLPFIRFMRIRI
eukprot:7160385-Pyramimonas_sp.AAC.1